MTVDKADSYHEQPARLVFLLEHLKFGGTQSQTLELVSRLDRSKFQAEIWLLTARDDLVPIAQRRGIPLVWLSSQARVGPTCLVKFWQRLKGSPVDLLILISRLPNLWGRIVARMAGISTIVGTCRGGVPHHQLEWLLWPLVNHLIVNSTAEKHILTKYYRIPGERITFIPNGVDVDYFCPPPPNSRAKPAKILSVGRLVSQKDHDTLIAAFGRIVKQEPTAELWIVGDGPWREILQRKVKGLFSPGRVRLLPSQLDLRPLFQEATLFALSSVYEGLPNVVLEAMASGLPVVATQVGGLAELVMPGQTGWLVPPRDPPALAAAINEALTSPKIREAFSINARQRVEERFSLNDMARRHQEVFLNLLANKFG